MTDRIEEIKNLKDQLEKAKAGQKRAEETLGSYVANAAHNAEVSRKLGALEVAIYKAGSLADLFKVFVERIGRDFDIPVVKIALVEEAPVTKSALNLVPFVILADYYRLIEDNDLVKIPGIKDLPVLKNADLDRYDELFTKKELESIKSMALVPMFSEGNVIGVICFGSHDREYYSPEKETDLLDKLGTMFALRIDNVLKSEELIKANSRLEEIAKKDGLTGLANFSTMQRVLSREFQRARRYKSILTVAYVDLDGFKEINDINGHEAGDEALKHFANQLEASARETDLVSRKSGDEFVIIFPQTEEQKAAQFFNRLRRVLDENTLIYENKSIPVLFSFGLASFDGVSERFKKENLLKQADNALYEDKKTKKTRKNKKE